MIIGSDNDADNHHYCADVTSFNLTYTLSVYPSQSHTIMYYNYVGQQWKT